MSQSEDSEALASHLVLAQTVILLAKVAAGQHHSWRFDGEA